MILFILIAYLSMFLFKPSMGLLSLQNSGYYIKEMLMIMPVIFVLTALLDMWVPKEKIMKYLGREAKGKGLLLAFALGSVSAGPIYAAFPMCIMLHKKGASIRNIVVILSSWAVIKVPMLLNEAKFLGFKFMLLRWILTILAILIFSWLTDRIVSDKDIPIKKTTQNSLTINVNSCMGCTLCTKHYPEAFAMKNKKATLLKQGDYHREKLEKAMTACPVKAIVFQ